MGMVNGRVVQNMEKFIFLLIMEGGSVLFFYFGFLLWKKNRIDIIHDYHTKKVKKCDKKAYTTIMGKAMVVIASGLTISGIIGLFSDPVRSGIPFGIAFMLGICIIIYAQIKYNHGIF